MSLSSTSLYEWVADWADLPRELGWMHSGVAVADGHIIPCVIPASRRAQPRVA